MTERNRGMWTCEVCGREFALMHEDRYTVRGVQKSGLIASIGSETEPVMWDAFDCPYCGCQNRTIIRMRTVDEITPERVSDEYGVDDESLCGVCPIRELCGRGEGDE